MNELLGRLTIVMYPGHTATGKLLLLEDDLWAVGADSFRSEEVTAVKYIEDLRLGIVMIGGQDEDLASAD